MDGKDSLSVKEKKIKKLKKSSTTDPSSVFSFKKERSQNAPKDVIGPSSSDKLSFCILRGHFSQNEAPMLGPSIGLLPPTVSPIYRAE